MATEKDIPHEQQKEYVLERSKTYNSIAKQIGENLSKTRSSLRQEYIESVRNLAIVAGAIATFSLMFADKFPSLYLITGITLLIFVVMLSFAHLFGLVDINSKDGISYKSRFLIPIQEVSKNCIDFLRKQKTFEDWLKVESDFLEKKYDELSGGLKDLSKKEDELNYTIDVIIILFTAANWLIAFALLKTTLVPRLAEVFQQWFFK